MYGEIRWEKSNSYEANETAWRRPIIDGKQSTIQRALVTTTQTRIFIDQQKVLVGITIQEMEILQEVGCIAATNQGFRK